MRRQAQIVGPSQQRRFSIEISAFEHVVGRSVVDVDDYSCLVYTVDMIAAEKLRAICQQSPQYAARKHPTPRARDFYDVYVAVNRGGVDFSSPELHALVEGMFRAKDVNLTLLSRIDEQRNFQPR